MYDPSKADSIDIDIEDKKALCSGITRVLAVLSPDLRLNALLSLSNPTIECTESLMKVASRNSVENTPQIDEQQIVERLGGEISILAITIRTFHAATSKEQLEEKPPDDPVLTVLDRIWPSVTYIASSLCVHQNISSALSELLLVVFSFSGIYKNIHLLTHLYDISATMMESVGKSNDIRAIDPVMDLVSEVVKTFGPIAEAVPQTNRMKEMSDESLKIRELVQQLLMRSFHLVNSITTEFQSDMLPPMFSICTAGIQKCPVLFMSLNTQADVNADGQIFVNSIKIAVSSIDSKHVDLARSAMLYLKEIVSRANFVVLSLVSSSSSPHAPPQ